MHPHRKDTEHVLFRAKIFKALADPIRLQIMEFLRQNEKCVCEIFPHVGIAQPLVSRHLKILKDAGLVNDRKEGNRRIYSILDYGIFQVIDAVSQELMSTLSTKIIERIS